MQNVAGEGTILKVVEEVQDSVIACMEHETHEKLVSKLVRTNDLRVIASQGIVLRTNAKSIRDFYEETERKKNSRTRKCTSNFMTD